MGINSEKDFFEDGVHYKITSDDGSEVAVISKGYGDSSYSGYIIIPEMVLHNGKKYIVQAIGAGAFRECKELKSVVIPHYVTIIGERAFSQSGLENIEIPETVVSIKEEAFSDCKNLESFTIEIEYGSPADYLNIGDGAFRGCSLKSVSIGAEKIGQRVFEGCKSLEYAEIYGTELGVKTFAGCENLKGVGLQDTIKCIKDRVFANCSKLKYIKVFHLPTTYEEMEAEARAEDCDDYEIRDEIKKREKERINISNVEKIGTEAFMNCTSITKVKAENLESIGARAFSGCTKLGRIELPLKLKKLGKGAFEKCPWLQNFRIPHGIKTLDGTFRDCTSLNFIYIPSNIEEIRPCTFSGVPLNTAIIGKGVKKILTEAFDCFGLNRFTGYNTATLEDVYCLSMTPPMCEYDECWEDVSKGYLNCYIRGNSSPDEDEYFRRLSYDLFFSNNYFFEKHTDIRLHVPKGTLEIYKNAEVWETFKVIIDDAPDIIEGDKIETGSDYSIYVDIPEGQYWNGWEWEEPDCSIIVEGENIKIEAYDLKGDELEFDDSDYDEEDGGQITIPIYLSGIYTVKVNDGKESKSFSIYVSLPSES